MDEGDANAPQISVQSRRNGNPFVNMGRLKYQQTLIYSGTEEET